MLNKCISLIGYYYPYFFFVLQNIKKFNQTLIKIQYTVDKNKRFIIPTSFWFKGKKIGKYLNKIQAFSEKLIKNWGHGSRNFVGLSGENLSESKILMKCF